MVCLKTHRDSSAQCSHSLHHLLIVRTPTNYSRTSSFSAQFQKLQSLVTGLCVSGPLAGQNNTGMELVEDVMANRKQVEWT